MLGELLELLLLATAVWLLLEHRADKHDLRPIYAASFVWGLGLAENWVMILALPLFVARHLGWPTMGILFAVVSGDRQHMLRVEFRFLGLDVLDGRSFVKTLREPGQSTKNYIFHAYPRGERIGRALIGLDFPSAYEKEALIMTIPERGEGYRLCQVLDETTSNRLKGESPS